MFDVWVGVTWRPSTDSRFAVVIFGVVVVFLLIVVVVIAL